MAESPRTHFAHLSTDKGVSSRRALRADFPVAARVEFGGGKHRGRLWTANHQGALAEPADRQRGGRGNAVLLPLEQRFELHEPTRIRYGESIVPIRESTLERPGAVASSLGGTSFESRITSHAKRRTTSMSPKQKTGWVQWRGSQEHEINMKWKLVLAANQLGFNGLRKGRG